MQNIRVRPPYAANYYIGGLIVGVHTETMHRWWMRSTRSELRMCGTGKCYCIRTTSTLSLISSFCVSYTNDLKTSDTGATRSLIKTCKFRFQIVCVFLYPHERPRFIRDLSVLESDDHFLKLLPKIKQSKTNLGMLNWGKNSSWVILNPFVFTKTL